MKIFIIHGVGGHNKENWFPWLQEELEKQGHEVFVPNFPSPEGQTLVNWFKVLDEYVESIDANTIFVGHSLGVAFVLNLLEKGPLKAAFLVAGFTGIAGNKFDESMKSFTQKDFDWMRIRENCKRFTVFHSDNDPYVPLSKGEELAKNLGTFVHFIPGAGHFNSTAGYKEFPELLEGILKVVKENSFKKEI